MTYSLEKPRRRYAEYIISYKKHFVKRFLKFFSFFYFCTQFVVQILICRGDGKSDIPPAAEWYYRKSDSDIKAYGFSAILFATLTCAANITAEGNNTAPRQYHSPQANRTAHFQCAKLQFNTNK